MFIIDFRNKNVSEYRFSVIGNSNVDMVHFYSLFPQYASNCSIYLKIRSNDETYIDKIAIASEDISVDDGALLCKWKMGAVSTQCKRVDLQLQFEKEGDIIAQTGIVHLTLADTIDVDHEIEPIYPEILKRLQEQIDDLKDESYALATASFSDDVLTLVFKNAEEETLTSLQVSIPLSGRLKIVYGSELVKDLPTSFALHYNGLTYIGSCVDLGIANSYEVVLMSNEEYFKQIIRGDSLLSDIIENGVPHTYALTVEVDNHTTIEDIYKNTRNNVCLLSDGNICKLTNVGNDLYNVEIIAKYGYYYSTNIEGYSNYEAYLENTDYVENITPENLVYWLGEVQPNFLQGFKIRIDNDIAYLIGTDSYGNELIYAPRGNHILVDSGSDTPLISIANDGKLEIKNLKTPSNDTDGATKKYVDDLVSAIRKNALEVVDIEEYPDIEDMLDDIGSFEEGYIYLYPINTSEAPDFSSGYFMYIVEMDDQDEPYWVYLGKTQLDLSNYVDKTSTQRITGQKSVPYSFTIGDYSNGDNAGSNIYFSGDHNPQASGDHNLYMYYDQFSGGSGGTQVYNFGQNGGVVAFADKQQYYSVNLIPNANNSKDLGMSGYAWKDLYLSGKIYGGAGTDFDLYINNTHKYRFTTVAFRPAENNAIDLGSSSYKWKYLYVAGKLYGASKNIAIDDIYSFLYNSSYTANTIIYLGVENVCSINSNTTFTFEQAPTGCYPEYKAIITNSHSTDAIVLTFTGVVNIQSNDENIVIAGNSLTLPAGTTIEVSCLNNNLVAFNWNI